MSEWRTWRDAAATHALLRGWRRAGAFDSDGMQRAQAAFDGADPSPREWRWFLDRFALSLGVVLCAAGILCFIAANWEHLGKFAKLYGFQALLLIGVLAAAKLDLRRIGGQAALWLATMVLGGLLALIGQIYQTGADTWELYALWTALALPWTFAARNAVQWLTWGALLNLAFGLWLGLHPRGMWFAGSDVAMWLGVLNLALLLAWDIADRQWPDLFGELGARVGRWLLVAAALAPLTGSAMEERLWDDRNQLYLTAVWGVAIVVLLWRYGHRRRDLPVIAMIALSLIAVVTASVGDVVFEGRETASDYLIVAITVLVQAAIAAVMLRRLAREDAR
jgi:uncharacterized membrane protein